MTLPIATSLFALMSYVIVLILVFSRQIKDNRSAQLFSLYIFNMLLLQGVYLLLSLTNSEREALLCYSLNIPLLISQVIIFLFFTKEFLGFKPLPKWVQAGTFSWLAIITSGVLLRPNFIFSEVYRNAAASLYVPELNPWATALLLPILLPISVIVYDLLKGYHQTNSPLQRVRIQYLFLAIAIVWLGMFANVSPLLRPYPLDVAANMVSGYLIAYAILRYQLLDINIVFRKGILFAVSVLLMVGGFFFSILFAIKIFPIQNEAYAWPVYFIFSTLMALVIIPLRDQIQQWIGQVVYRDKINGFAMIERISHDVAHILDPRELANKIIGDIVATMQIQWAAFYLEHNSVLHQIAERGSGTHTLMSLDLDHPVSHWLVNENKIVTIDTLNEMRTGQILTKHQWMELQQTNLELLVPLKTREKLVGVLGLGPKLTRQSYTQDDEFILNALAGPVAIALENARLYDTVQEELTERKKIGKEREALIVELKSKNTELEQFTYTVSHDLKSPLITIRGFLGYLEKDALSGNAERVRNDVARIVQASEKMQRLLTELLELSRIGRIMNPPEEVNFAQLAQEAISLVQGQIQKYGVQVHITGNTATVYGDRARLLEVLQNLVDNAIKFMGDQVEPHIEISQDGTDPDGKPIFFVQDNGIGIEPQYHERIFGLFNKLDAHSEGTGIGLALVKRIIEVHGGCIWVESEGAGKGTKFLFTLPPHDDNRITASTSI